MVSATITSISLIRLRGGVASMCDLLHVLDCRSSACHFPRRMGEFFATCAKGLEPLLAAELRALGAATVNERRAGVELSGPLEIAYRACLWSRVANRVLLPLSSFAAPDPDALYEG